MESPHLVTISLWFFTTIVACGFVGSEPEWMSNTLKSKGWKNCPEIKTFTLSAPGITLGDMATGLSGLRQRPNGMLCAGSEVIRMAFHMAFLLCHVNSLKLEHSIPSSPCVCADIR